MDLISLRTDPPPSSLGGEGSVYDYAYYVCLNHD